MPPASTPNTLREPIMITECTRREFLGTASLGLATSAFGQADAPAEFDVVVYGATPAGVCAAVAAARAGASTVLVEPDPLVGGMMSSGLSFSDSNQCDRRTLGGLFDEVHRRIADEYRRRGTALDYDPAVKDQSRWTYEPHVAEKVFNELLATAGVAVRLGHALEGVDKDRLRLTALRTDRGRIAGKQFVDAGYEGDLLAAAGVSHVIGRESKKQYGESLAGHRFPKAKVAVSPRLEGGGLLPLMTGAEVGPDDGDGCIMTYSFRVTVSRNPANRVPIEKPANYEAAQFELARRTLKVSAKPEQAVNVDVYPIPGDKADINNGIGKQVSSGLVGASWAYPKASAKDRRAIWQAHKDYTLAFLWFLQSDPAVPEKIRNAIAPWGLAKDEFAKYENFPPVMYIREARRMVGEHVLTQADVLRDIAKPDAIGIGSFPIDSHDCRRVAVEGGWINEGTIFPAYPRGRRYGQPHQIPYRSLLPKASECVNLLVPVCLSASHVALSSVRVEPTWMMLGQAAGVAAALCAKAKSGAHDLPAADLQRALRSQKHVVDLRDDHLADAKAAT